MSRHRAAVRPSSPWVMAASWAALAAVGILGLTASGMIGTRPAPRTPMTVQAGLMAAEPVVSPATAVLAPTQAAAPSAAQPTVDPGPNRALAALKIALAQIGLPYVWGGDGPANGDVGFDCSGLTHFAYAMAGISLPRTAHTQFYAGPHVPAGEPLHPGDLVFYGASSFVHHVGMYVGSGRMVNAPTFGEPVQVAYYRWLGDDYIGATRPDDSSAIGVDELPFIPETQGRSPSGRTGRALPRPASAATRSAAGARRRRAGAGGRIGRGRDRRGTSARRDRATGEHGSVDGRRSCQQCGARGWFDGSARRPGIELDGRDRADGASGRGPHRPCGSASRCRAAVERPA